jgi:hypothetical protein
LAKAGGGGNILVEPGLPTVNSFIGMTWVKAKLDLAALARLRWIKRWSIDRLSEHFGVSGTRVKRQIRAIRRNPRSGGLSKTPPNIRGR